MTTIKGSLLILAIWAAGAGGVLAQPIAKEHGSTTIAPAGDSILARAEAEARETLPIFLAKWRGRAPGASAFRVKAGFPTDDGRGTEHLWLTVERVSADGAITGRLSNDPVRISSLASGSVVTVPQARVSDWMYVRGGKMYGQFTGRANLGRMPAEMRAQLQAILAPTPLEAGDH
jgi:uncharacterized protein YegJ (DUF2314 family)